MCLRTFIIGLISFLATNNGENLLRMLPMYVFLFLSFSFAYFVFHLVLLLIHLQVFYHLTYAGSVDVNTLADPILREATRVQLNNFGVTPTQLFKGILSF